LTPALRYAFAIGTSNAFLVGFEELFVVESSILMASSSFNPRKKAPGALPRVEAPIWATRPVEWPFTKIPLSMLAKLLKSSRVAGQQLGLIYQDGTASTNPDGSSASDGGSPFKAGVGGGQASTNASGSTGQQPQPASSQGVGDGSYFSGLMSRVLNTSGGATNAATTDDWLEAEQALSSKSNSFQTLRPPRCVAVANGWIVAIHEVSLPNNALLRFLSRWNVRRGVTSIDWVALPPPATPSAKIKHVFSDPTASHVFISADNGEAYYSSNRNNLTRLNGFGNADTKVVGNAQVGLTPNSYVTAIAWDKERGTEGSTKTILLGTNLGEIYEYSLTESATPSPGPTLLRQLGSTNAITGLSFERLRTGLVVLVSTRTGSQRTRLYSYAAQHSSSNFRFVVQDSNQNVQELPGTDSIAELILLQDHFALQTQFGIYYGAIDRNLPAAVSANVLVDAGLLRWEDILDSSPIASLALTPHHLVVLTEAHEVRFINWIAQKVIQKEVIEFHSDDALSSAEFMMDIRRPDQIWLRKGRSLVHISSSQEDRDVWKFTLQKCLTKLSPAGTVPEIGAPLTDDEKAQEALFDQAKTMCTVASQKVRFTLVSID
jgi:Pep3/Vps18/deep orange family